MIPVPAQLTGQLLELHTIHSRVLATTPGPWAPVFLTPTGQPLRGGDTANALRSFYALLSLASIARREEGSGCTLDIHALRTTCGSRWAREGVPPQVVQYLLGHSDIRVTMKHYVFLSTEDARAALVHASQLPSPCAFVVQPEAAAPPLPWNKPGTGHRSTQSADHYRRTQTDSARAVASGGPRRTRTYDQAIMSHLL